MGCSKCKKKKNQNQDQRNINFQQVDGNDVKSGIHTKDGKTTVGIGADIFDGLSEISPQNFVVRLIVLVAMIIVIPLIVVYLLFIFIKALFLPSTKDLSLGFEKLVKLITYPIDKVKEFRKNIKLKSREKEFAKKRGYEEGSELLDIELFEPEELKQKRAYSGEEELDGVEVIETENTNKEDNDKDEK